MVSILFTPLIRARPWRMSNLVLNNWKYIVHWYITKWLKSRAIQSILNSRSLTKKIHRPRSRNFRVCWSVIEAESMDCWLRFEIKILKYHSRNRRYGDEYGRHEAQNVNDPTCRILWLLCLQKFYEILHSSFGQCQGNVGQSFVANS